VLDQLVDDCVSLCVSFRLKYSRCSGASLVFRIRLNRSGGTFNRIGYVSALLFARSSERCSAERVVIVDNDCCAFAGQRPSALDLYDILDLDGTFRTMTRGPAPRNVVVHPADVQDSDGAFQLLRRA